VSEPTSNIDAIQKCRLCGKAFTVRGIIERATSYWSMLDVVKTTSPCCNTTDQLRLENGTVWRGYVYAAGGPHFSAEERYEAPTLTIKRKRSDLCFLFDGKEYVIAEQL
jgi:hypothetical protein